MIPASTIPGVSPGAVDKLIAEYGEKFMDPWWRLTSGVLYRCIDKDGNNVPFIPNDAQGEFLRDMWYRNAILKARQLGFTTLACIYNIDHAMFVPDQHCGIVAHDNDTATKIFANKVKFVYENLPDIVISAFPLRKETQSQITFEHNGSYVHVDTSMRGDTINRGHISELGKMSAKYPDRAREVMTGTLPAIPLHGVGTVESTAEGVGGDFYNMCKIARAHKESGKPLGPRDYKFFFFPWYLAKEYRVDPSTVVISPKDHQYFDKLEGLTGDLLDLEQRAWYIATLHGPEVAGNRLRMMQEYPSTPDEAWTRDIEGSFFAAEMAQARADGRIRELPIVNFVPVNTFWDIGHRDGTGIWLHQYVHPAHHLLRYVEGWGEPYQFFINALDKIRGEGARGFVWGKHYLPHDARNKRQTVRRVCSPLDELQEFKPDWKFEIVPPVDERQHGIQALRKILPMCVFDEEGCKEGIEHMIAYSKKWNTTTAEYTDEPVKDRHTEAPDALRQLAQAVDSITGPGARAGQTPKREGARRRAV